MRSRIKRTISLILVLMLLLMPALTGSAQTLSTVALPVYHWMRSQLNDALTNEPFKDVPLINTLYAVSDLDGLFPLTRYYMASPSLQTADIGFGPGWLTNYSVHASVVEMEGIQWLTIATPVSTRLFAGNGRQLIESGGYATARLHSHGGITVTEANGGTLVFDTSGRIAAATDAYRRKTAISYDGQGRLIEVVRDDESLSFAYGTDGLIETVSSGGDTVTYAYTDSHLAGANGPNGQESYTYDNLPGDSRCPLASADSAAGTLRIQYDDEGMPVQINQDGSIIEIAYADKTITMSMGDDDVVFRLDEYGQYDRIEYGDVYSEWIVSGEELLLRSVQADGLTVETGYSLKMEPLWQKDANGHTVRFAYDQAGNVQGVTDANGNETKYAYDKPGNLTRIIYADGTREFYTYNGKDGSLARYTDRAGKDTSFSYDQQGNLTRAAYADDTMTQFEYDEAGKLTSVREGDRVASVQENGDGGLKLGFDDGQELSLQWEASSVIVNAGTEAYTTMSEFDNGRLANIGNPLVPSLSRLEYDEQNRVIRETRANATYATYEYNADGLLARIENHGADGSLHSFYAYEYDGVWNIVSQETIEGVWQYGYDVVRQLTKVVDPDGVVTEYAYDPAGNRVSETADGILTLYEANALNQYTRAGDVQYTYDKNGQLKRKEGPDGATEYNWDARGRLVSVDDGATRTEYGYDVFGNRDAVTVNGETTRYMMAPTELPFVVFANAEVGETYYHYGDNGLIASESNGERLYYSFTPLGSVSEITDADGNLLRQYAYDAMGRVTGQTAFSGNDAEVVNRAEMTAANPFTYVGRYDIMDDGNGLWYMRARHTAQDVGRFISPDPSRQTYDLNIYRYAVNNPVNVFDLNGCEPWGFTISTGQIKIFNGILNLVSNGFPANVPRIVYGILSIDKGI